MLGSVVQDMLPEDHLVVHIRSGDSVIEITNWVAQDATTDNFNENHDIRGVGIQPGCAYYHDLDAALRLEATTARGPFTKVHVVVDLKCEKDHVLEHDENNPRTCGSTNPCLLADSDSHPVQKALDILFLIWAFPALAKAFAGNKFRPNPCGCGLNSGRATPLAVC